MEKELVPKEQSLDLKELGFDEPCLFAYNQDDENKLMTAPQLSSYQINTGKNSDIGKINKVTSPTFSQAFRFFREKYNLLSRISYKNDRYKFEYQYKSSANNLYMTKYSTYEEAELECLKKLIEIVKDSK